jgi:hypothetical protein
MAGVKHKAERPTTIAEMVSPTASQTIPRVKSTRVAASPKVTICRI